MLSRCEEERENTKSQSTERRPKLYKYYIICFKRVKGGNNIGESRLERR